MTNEQMDADIELWKQRASTNSVAGYYRSLAIYEMQSLQAENERLRVALSGASGVNIDEELKARNEELQAENERLKKELTENRVTWALWIKQHEALQSKLDKVKEALQEHADFMFVCKILELLK